MIKHEAVFKENTYFCPQCGSDRMVKGSVKLSTWVSVKKCNMCGYLIPWRTPAEHLDELRSVLVNQK